MNLPFSPTPGRQESHPSSPASSSVKPDSDQRQSAWLLLTALAFFLLRLGFAPFPNLYPEEAYYWNYAQHLDIGYLDHPPMVAWLIHLGTAVFGNTESGVRAAALACSLVTSFFLFVLTERLYGRASAAWAVLLAQMLPFFFLSGWVMTPDAPLTACWSALLYFLSRALLEGRARAWWGVGLALGLGLLSKYTIALLGAATLLFLVLDRPSRRWFWHPAPYASVLLALVLFSPALIWNWQHHWASFAFQSTERVHQDDGFSLHALLASVAVLLTPVGLYLAGSALLARGDREEGAASEASRRRLLFARVFTLVPLTVFVAFSCRHAVKLNWTGPLWLALLPAMASLAAAFSRRGRIALGATAGVLAAVYLGFFQYLTFGLPGVRYSPQTALLPVGWAQLGGELAQRKQAVEATLHRPVLLVGMDRNFLASEAAFYHPDQKVGVRDSTSMHLFNRISLMYEFWFPPEKLLGATLLLVSWDAQTLDEPRVLKRCGSLGSIEKSSLEVKGAPVRPYYTRVAYDYRGGGLNRVKLAGE